MRFLSIFVLLFSLGSSAFAQLDIATARANPKTFIFDNNQNTVHGYVYDILQQETSCCGNDAIYLEVKFDNTGTVTSAKTLTGRTDCFKKSVVDIIYRVKWDATGVTGTKTIYFEVKPIIPCSGSPGENVYKALDRGSAGAVAVNENTGGDDNLFSNEEVSSEETGNEMEEETEEVVEEVAEETEEVVEEVEEVVEESIGDSEEFFEEAEEIVEEVTEETEEVVEEVEEVAMDDNPNVENDFMSNESSEESFEEENTRLSGDDNSNTRLSGDKEKNGNNRISTDFKGSTPVVKNQGKSFSGKIPPQADKEYVSKGERRPDESHAESHVNINPKTMSQYRQNRKVSNPNEVAVEIRRGLKEAKFCGLAVVAVELTVDPSGRVIESRMLAANKDELKTLVPQIASKIQFEAKSGSRANTRNIFQFKTEITCGDQPQYDLDKQPNPILTSSN